MLVSVAVPLPFFKPLTYAVPAAMQARVAVGSRVVVPVRGRREMGFVIGEGVARDGVTPKPIADAPDAHPVLDRELIELCAWIAEYYVTPLGVVLRTALPAALTGPATPVPQPKTRRRATIAKELPTLIEREQTFARAKKQRELYELIESLGGSAPVELLTERMSFSASVLGGLTERGFIAIADEVVARDPFATRAVPPLVAHRATPQQQAAIDAMASARPGEVFLLHGVTGSGKTLVYLELLKKVVNERGQSAIVLVPEIALTPQTVGRFRAVFGDKVAVLHSALSDGERYDAWLALRRGEKRIAVGARSAIFAPLPDLGAVILDEEHESSYKQGESPRYHAREVAIVRARAHGAVVVLGSATPSLETWANTLTKKFTLLSLPARVGEGKLPVVRIVDMRVPKEQKFSTHATTAEELVRLVLSEPLEDALRQRLERQEQAILLLNRRGYASFVQCAQCGEVDTCPNCSITLTYHRAPERLVCHYCQHAEPRRERCKRCGGLVLRQRGLGTQQVERILAERMPSSRIARMDVDTTSGKWAHADILDRVARGDVDVLLGTQMIAKGLDFPNVTLVGVVDADVGINLPDFRASERCFQLLSQVAGRAGRGPKGGEVFIQTRVPAHHAVQCAVDHDYQRFVTKELASREDPPYPPAIRLVNVVFSGLREEETAELAIASADRLRAMLEKRPEYDVTIVGPAKCPIERIKNRWRWHLMLKSSRPSQLTRVSRFFAEKVSIAGKGQLRITVDRDPVALL
ncbi:MAG TPA: primosomal protein N' [Gemmatimonadaceae bacterium]|nr:primosomal protein N' [Gemmatimonadaceae bacterium]